MDVAGEKPAERPSGTVVSALSHTDNSKTSNLHDSLTLKLGEEKNMKRLYGIVTLVALLMGGALLLERTVRVAAAAPPSGIKNIVLVHGAFADGSGWEAVAKILERDGYTVSVAQPP